MSKETQIERTKKMAVACAKGTSLRGTGCHNDAEGELMGECDCLVELMMLTGKNVNEVLKELEMEEPEVVGTKCPYCELDSVVNGECVECGAVETDLALCLMEN